MRLVGEIELQTSIWLACPKYWGPCWCKPWECKWWAGGKCKCPPGGPQKEVKIGSEADEA